MISCSFCKNIMRATVPIDNCPAFRCIGCNIRIVITNQSYMPRKLISLYWFLVKTQQLSTYQASKEYHLYNIKKERSQQ